MFGFYEIKHVCVLYFLDVKCSDSGWTWNIKI